MPATIDEYIQLSTDYQVVERALQFLAANQRRQPGLQEVAASVGYSESHFQRLFTRWVGISPKRFLQFLTKEHAKRLLERSENLLEVSFQSGLSSPGRLHDLFITCEAVTPGTYKQRGAGLEIVYGFHPSPFGDVLLALTQLGICHLAFVSLGGKQQALDELRSRWSRAVLIPDESATAQVVQQVFSFWQSAEKSPLSIHLNGTNFQLKVWEALVRIPAGSVVSYEDLAISINRPTAARAIGQALGSNPVPVLIPCHRVIQKVGAFGDYRYGAVRKQAMLGWEMARDESQSIV